MPRPIQARIDVNAVQHNYLVAKHRVATPDSAAKAWAVVKADAYGHGLMRVRITSYNVCYTKLLRAPG